VTTRPADHDRAGYAERLVGVLKLFAEYSDVLSIAEVAQKLALPPSSTHRVLKPLVKLGLIERGPKRRYRIGTELYRLALLIQDHFELMNVAKPIMIEMARKSGEICLLGLLAPNRRRIVLVHKIDSSRASPTSFDLLENITPAWGSVGRSIMAWVQLSDVVQIMKDAGPSPITGELLPPLVVLEKELAEIRRRGVAFSLGKRSADNAGLAAPFFDGTGQVRGGIGIIVPKQRLTEDAYADFARIVKFHSARLSHVLGYRARRRRPVKPGNAD
jgi:DNA-binding IclR family transcriptional regulator